MIKTEQTIKRGLLSQLCVLLGKRKVQGILIVFTILLTGWLLLGYYLYSQVKQSRAIVEQKRIEASRREEAARRQAIYQQEVQKYQQSFRPQSRAYGE